MLITEHPGHWLDFVRRPDNVGLTTEQQRQKYIKEQLLYENFISFQLQQQTIMQSAIAAAAGGASGGRRTVPQGGIPAGCIQFVIDTADSESFDLDIEISADTIYTITWGDGTTDGGLLSAGRTTLSHTFPTGRAQYTTRLCFSDASVVTYLDFPGFD